jgi:hypothetical protein
MDPCSHLESQVPCTTYSRPAKIHCLVAPAYIILRLCHADIVIYGQTCMYSFLKYYRPYCCIHHLSRTNVSLPRSLGTSSSQSAIFKRSATGLVGVLSVNEDAINERCSQLFACVCMYDCMHLVYSIDVHMHTILCLDI